ncbi:MAG: phosphotransferase [Chitinivibrionales bacterium]|nr:phosphotransferase [Chitinivibrionales bacterium]
MTSTTSKKRKHGILHLGRYGEILSIFIKYGFGDIVSQITQDSLFSKIILRRKTDKTVAKQHSRWERVRLAIEELGPTFIKFGQFMSNRPDILPLALITELEKLQDMVKPFSFQEAVAIVQEELHEPITQLFPDFSEQPIASASIAQVHSAVLATGKKVAVKIQRPKIVQRIRTDIDILYHAVILLERQYEKARVVRLRQLVEEFEKVLEKELDFTVEATSLEKFRHNFKHERGIYFPALFSAYTTKRILVTEFIHGVKVSELHTMHTTNLDKSQLAMKGAECILKQIFDHGFFHADPHPGNILVQADGTICFLDFGAVGIIPPSLRYCLSILLFGVVSKDSQRIVKTLSLLTNQPIKDIHALEYEITEFIEDYAFSMLRDINIGELLQRFFNILINHNLKIVPGFYLLLKTMITIEGVGLRLDPEFSLAKQVEPFIRKIMFNHPRMRFLPYDLYFSLIDCFMLAKDMPADILETLKIVKNGELRINFQHKGLEPLIQKSDQLVNRLVFAIVLASLIVGSSVVVLAGIPPKMYDIPLVGLVGFVMAGIIGFGLIFSILRHKKM